MPDLTTLTAVKNWQGGLSVSNTTADSLLAQLITATSSDFLRETNRVDLLESGYTETRIGDGSPRLITRHWPIVAVTSLSVGGVPVPTETSSSAGWYIDEETDPERRYVVYMTNGGYFTDQAVIQIKYVAGYATTPQDVQQAVTEWVVYRYTKKMSPAQTQARGVEGERADFEEEAIPPNTQRVIQHYIREFPRYGKATAAESGAQSENADRVAVSARVRGGTKQ